MSLKLLLFEICEDPASWYRHALSQVKTYEESNYSKASLVTGVGVDTRPF